MCFVTLKRLALKSVWFGRVFFSIFGPNRFTRFCTYENQTDRDKYINCKTSSYSLVRLLRFWAFCKFKKSLKKGPQCAKYNVAICDGSYLCCTRHPSNSRKKKKKTDIQQ